MNLTRKKVGSLAGSISHFYRVFYERDPDLCRHHIHFRPFLIMEIQLAFYNQRKWNIISSFGRSIVDSHFLVRLSFGIGYRLSPS